MSENVLQEAERLVARDRNADYGPMPEEARRFAQIASAITGLDIQPKDYALLMIAVKLSREAHHHKRDNLVDAAGYLLGLQEIHEQP